MTNSHRGVYAAPLMPMRADLSADHQTLRIAEACWMPRCQGLMPLGSTGEAH